MKRVGELQVHQDVKFEVAERRVSLIAWALLVLFLVAAGAGFTGSGPINQANASQGAIRVQYPHVLRQNSAAEIVIGVPGSALTINSSYLSQLTVEEIMPSPVGISRSGEHIRFDFKEPPGSVRLSIEPNSPGVIKARIGAESDGVEFRQLILP